MLQQLKEKRIILALAHLHSHKHTLTELALFHNMHHYITLSAEQAGCEHVRAVPGFFCHC